MQKTILKNVSSEIVEKKSKFIANIFYVENEQEAEEKIKAIKKKYHDAKHHCFAYSIMIDDKLLNRMSDDGEPSGTAGMPILNILTKKELVNVLVVVTRYFGGILLGTGGLVKAYSDSTLLALANAEFVELTQGLQLELILDYSDFDKFQYYSLKNNITIIKVNYSEKIICQIELTNEEKNKLVSLNENDSFKIQKYSILGKKTIKKNVDI